MRWGIVRKFQISMETGCLRQCLESAHWIHQQWVRGILAGRRRNDGKTKKYTYWSCFHAPCYDRRVQVGRYSCTWGQKSSKTVHRCVPKSHAISKEISTHDSLRKYRRDNLSVPWVAGNSTNTFIRCAGFSSCVGFRSLCCFFAISWRSGATHSSRFNINRIIIITLFNKNNI